MSIKLKHNTVLLNEAVNSLNIKKDGIYVDATFGCGGHSKLILSKLGSNGRLIAIDRDPYAVELASNIKDSRFSIIYGSFSNLLEYINERKLLKKVDGILLDLGLSSMQLDEPERGFSFMNDGPLDMRMNTNNGFTAAEWLLSAKEKEIYFILKTYGEERFAKRIARNIINHTRLQSIMRTKDLVQIILDSIPIKSKFKHPATRSFQAIRIYINNELEELQIILKSSLNVLATKGRLSIISFHSLEDRIVKYFINYNSKNLQIPSKLPITEIQLQTLNQHVLKNIGRLLPKKQEIINNPRSRSAILRIAEKL